MCKQIRIQRRGSSHVHTSCALKRNLQGPLEATLLQPWVWFLRIFTKTLRGVWVSEDWVLVSQSDFLKLALTIL